MPTLSIQIKNATLVRQGLENLKKEIPAIGAQRIYTVMLRAQAILKRAGKRIAYPVHWDSEKQRRAFFATKGFGKGIPYQRTGQYNAGWRIRRNPRPARATEGYSLINEVPHAKHVGGNAYGEMQSRIHRGRWARVRDVVEQSTRGLREDVERHVGMVARRKFR